jgi:YVTN family beta-propeller protein
MKTRLLSRLVALTVLAAGCSNDAAPPDSPISADASPNGSPPTTLPDPPPMPPPPNVFAEAGVDMLAPAVRGDRPLVYVPHSGSGDVRVIDPATYHVVATYPAGHQVQHVVPSHDLRTLYATDNVGNQLLPFDARTGQPGRTIPVIDPYNLYFTPDGQYAISVAERMRELIWYDPRTWQIRDRTPAPACAGINHADFAPDGRTAVFTCEFAGRVAVVDVPTHKLMRVIDMPVRHTHMGPQDIRLAPDGSVYYIADSDAGGVWVLDGTAHHVLRFIPTGKGAHGLYFSRDAMRLFVTNRLEGSISVLDAYTGAGMAQWRLPGGGSPDMGNLTADGAQLWLSGRYHGSST